MTVSDELKRQIEAAFHYRGHVTLAFKDGTSVEGYLFNRDYELPAGAAQEGYFLDVFLKGSGDKARFWMKDLASIALTGVDEAAGKSYQEWMKKQEKGPR
jgi:hypothetical protein